MRLLPLLLLARLWPAGCHLFANAEIDQTCEDLNTCSPKPGGPGDDSGTGEEGGEGGGEETTDPGPDPEPEDCDDGLDNDLDGNADCEDEDCLERCMEDCNDEVDNDLDGDADCADDECYGVGPCEGPYDLTLTVSFSRVRFLWGELSMYGYDHRAEIRAYGPAYVSATPAGWDGDAFSCSGQIYVSTDTGTDIGVRYGGAEDGVPYWFTLYPNTADGSLAWYAPCPLYSLPEWDWGFRKRRDYFYVRGDGGWEPQYYAYSHYLSDFTSATLEYFPYPAQLAPLHLYVPVSP